MLYAPPALDYDPIECGQDSVRLWASSAGNPAGLRWDFGDPGSGTTNARAGGQYVAHHYGRGGTYTVSVTLADGRTLRRPVQVPGSAADLSDTNVFTPNGDGLNDTFRPVLGEGLGEGLAEEARLRIYSRWGQLVFETSGPAPRWDGSGQAGGDYFYHFSYRDCQHRPQARRGTVTLIR